MLKFSFILPIILSSLYFSFSWAQGTLSSCATNCSQTAGNSAGCNPGQLNQPNCVCTNSAFFGAASGCVWLSCTPAEADSAETYWLGVCAAYKASLSSAASSASSATTGYGGYTSVASVSVSNPYATSTPAVPTYANPTTVAPIISTTTPNTSPIGASNSGSGTGASSKPSTSPSTPSSNLAATMPTHAAALIAGGVGVMVAILV